MPDEIANDEHLPERLAEALKAADRAPLLVTARVDRAVAESAQAHFRHRRPSWRRRGGWAALAASVALLAVLATEVGGPSFPGGAGSHGDVDGSGRVDIADVFALARSEQPGVGQADLDAFAMRVVSLDGATR